MNNLAIDQNFINNYEEKNVIIRKMKFKEEPMPFKARQTAADYIDQLIHKAANFEYGEYVLSIHDLTDKELMQISCLMIQEANYDSDCFTDSKSSSYASDRIARALSKMLFVQDFNSRMELCELIQKNSIEVHKNAIEELIGQRCSLLSMSPAYDSGYDSWLDGKFCEQGY